MNQEKPSANNSTKKDEEDTEYTRKKIEILRIHGCDLRSKYLETLSIIPDNSYQDWLLTKSRIRIGKELLPKENGEFKKIYDRAAAILKEKPKIIESAYSRADFGGTTDRFYFYKFTLKDFGEFTAIEQQYEKTFANIRNMQYEQLIAEMSKIDDEIFNVLTEKNIIKSHKPDFFEKLDEYMVNDLIEEINSEKEK